MYNIRNVINNSENRTSLSFFINNTYTLAMYNSQSIQLLFVLINISYKLIFNCKSGF